jgi:hypothetical protein
LFQFRTLKARNAAADRAFCCFQQRFLYLTIASLTPPPTAAMLDPRNLVIKIIQNNESQRCRTPYSITRHGGVDFITGQF